MSDKLTDRERELVEAAKRVLAEFWRPTSAEHYMLSRALRAYDPPKREEPSLPPFDDLSAAAKKKLARSCWNSQEFAREVYKSVREALSTEEE